MLIDKFFAELFGTFVFLAIIVTIVETHSIYDSAQAWLKIPLVLTASILAFGFISGANFNPAVSLLFYMDKRLTLLELVTYIIAQCLGAILAYAYYVYTKQYLNRQK